MEALKIILFSLLIQFHMVTMVTGCGHTSVYGAIEAAFSAHGCISEETCAKETTDTLSRCFYGSKWIAAVWTPELKNSGNSPLCYKCTSLPNACSCYDGTITTTNANGGSKHYGFLVANSTCHLGLQEVPNLPFETSYYSACEVMNMIKFAYSQYKNIRSLCASGALRYKNAGVFVAKSQGTGQCLQYGKGNNDDIFMWFFR